MERGQQGRRAWCRRLRPGGPGVQTIRRTAYALDVVTHGLVVATPRENEVRVLGPTGWRRVDHEVTATGLNSALERFDCFQQPNNVFGALVFADIDSS